MQTPLPSTNKLTGLLQPNNSFIPISPYRFKIKQFQTKLKSTISSYKFKFKLYKWSSKLLLSSTIITSSLLLYNSYSLKGPQNSNIGITKCIPIINFLSIFSYSLIQRIFKKSVSLFQIVNHV